MEGCAHARVRKNCFSFFEICLRVFAMADALSETIAVYFSAN